MFELQFIAFVAIGASVGGFVNGIAGFGTGLFALGWRLLVLTPMTSVLSNDISVVSSSAISCKWTSRPCSYKAKFKLATIIKIFNSSFFRVASGFFVP